MSLLRRAPRARIRYGGQAHIARAAQPSDAVRTGLGRLSVHARQHQGGCTPSAGATPMAAGGSSTPCATRPPDHFLATYKAGEPRPLGRRAAVKHDVSLRGPRRARRPLAADCSSLSTAAPTGLSGRYARLRPAAQRRAPRRPVVQVPPAARHSCRGRRRAQRAGCGSSRRGAVRTQSARDPGRDLRRAAGAEPEPLAEPRLRSRRRQRCAVAVHPGRLLLQDLHVAAARVEVTLRAADPRCRRTRDVRRRWRTPTAIPTGSLIATCWSWGRGRPASPRRSTAAATGARVILCDEQPELGGSLLSEPPDRACADDGHGRATAASMAPGAVWLARAMRLDEQPARHRAAPHHGVRLLSRTTWWHSTNA